MVLRLARSRAIRRASGFLALVVLAAIVWNVWIKPGEDPAAPAAERTRNALELREDQRLYVPGAAQPFNGLLVENFSKGVRKLEIEIHDGKAHGHSRGWYDNGQLEVDETFVHGVSNGRRTRWHANGKKRSEADIVDGVIEGTYLEWHENGAKAAEMTLKNGVPDGVARTWYPSGVPKSRLEHDAGKITQQQSWPETATATTPGQ